MQSSSSLRLRSWRVLLTLAAITSWSVVGFALFTNGGFESGSFTGWSKSTFINPGLSGPPFTYASIDMSDTSAADWSTVVGSPGGGPLSVPVTETGGALLVPRFGDHAAVINYPGGNYPGGNANVLKQSTTVQSSDVDSLDGKVHVRLAYAPVLSDGAHSAASQAFFYIIVRNKSRANAVLYEAFAYANQPGVPWQVAGSYTFTDWQVVDIAPGNASLAIGDEIELEAVASGCSLGGHAGWVYVDAFGSFIPGPSVIATAPSQVNASSPLTYTITARNQGTGALGGGIVRFTTPANTTFASVANTTECSEAGGVVTCNIGTLNVGSTFSTQVTVNVGAVANGTVIGAGNYSIEGTGEPPLLGPLVNSTVTGDTLIDLAMQVTNGVSGAGNGQTLTYTITAQNLSSSAVTGAPVMATPPATLTNVSWTCTASSGGSCAAASGTGAISSTVDLAANGTATYTLTGTVAGLSGTLSMPAVIAAPGGSSDQDPSNNSAADNDVFVPNVAPVAGADAYTAPGPLSVNAAAGVLANDIDGDGNPLTAVLVAGPSHGTLVFNANGSFTYTPTTNYAGPDSFTYRASDGSATSAVTTVTLTVTYPPFYVTHVYPATGPSTGGTNIRIFGGGFRLAGQPVAPTVRINGVASPAVVVESANVVSAMTPALPAGAPLDVELIVPAGAATLAQAYTPYERAEPTPPTEPTEPTDPTAPPAPPADPTNPMDPTAPTVDTDGDGIPDVWEEFYGTDPLDPGDANADPDGDGKTNKQEYDGNTHPDGRAIRYFAEGNAAAPFRTWVNVYNPSPIEAAINITFYLDDATVVHHLLKAAGTARTTVDTGAIAALQGHAFGMRVDADESVVLNRTITWNEAGEGAAAERAVELSATWYFAEGATHANLQTFALLTNPADQPATVEIEYLISEAGARTTRTHVVPAHSRYTVWVNHEGGELLDQGFGMVVRSSHPIVAERATYITAGSRFDAGETSVGVTAPGLDWYFAEGAAGPAFNSFLLLANPTGSTAEVQVRYLPEAGPEVVRTHVVGPYGRVTVPANLEYDWAPHMGFGMHVHVTNGVNIVAERAMWWSTDDDSNWEEGHGSAGSSVTGTSYAIGDGVAGGVQGASTYLLIANPGTTQAQVRVTLAFEDGSAPVAGDFLVEAGTRFTIDAATTFPASNGKRFSARVDSLNSAPIVVEQSMYWTLGTGVWKTGISLPATRLGPID